MRCGKLFVGWWLLTMVLTARGIGADEPATADAKLEPAGKTPALLDTGVGLKAPAGFKVELFADDPLAHDIFSMTIDSHGRVVVAGKGYVKILHDDDGDGRADRATLFSDVPKSGAHGLCFDGDDLICTGDNAVMRLRDANGDGVADGRPEIWTKQTQPLKHSEHGANGIVKGPDGWFYVVCGNDAGVSEAHATTPHSPVKKPNCGAIVRFSPDGKQSEIVAHGFRNPYDLDFNEHGHLFTVDSDGERDQYLPWYTPTRLFDVAIGQHHGWVLRGWQHSWNRPEYFVDNVPRLAEFGRGSPTGVVVYRHRQFPERYRGSVLNACWTLGRVYHCPLTPKGSSYESQKEIFLETTGDVGFAPVDLAVGPRGDLFIAIGGRGTRGGVFRVSYTGDRPANPGSEKPVTADDSTTRLLEVLNADQRLASWSRTKWEPVARKLGKAAFEKAAVDEALSLRLRIAAIEVLVDPFDAPISLELVSQLASSPLGNDLVARAMWAASRVSPESVPKLSLAFLSKKDARVRRAAWESITATEENFPALPWAEILAESDRRVCAAGITAYARRLAHTDSFVKAAMMLEQGLIEDQDVARAFKRRGMADTFFRNVEGLTRKLIAVRELQFLLGDVRTEVTQPSVYAGYIASKPRDAEDDISFWLNSLPKFPSGDRNLDREVARTLGMLGKDESGLVERMAKVSSENTSVEDDIHYLIVLSLLPGPRSEKATRETAYTLVELQHKMRAGQMVPSRNWPLRVGEMFEELCKRDAKLAQTLIDSISFSLPEHSLFATRMPVPLRESAARKLLRASRKLWTDERWTPELVEVIGSLPTDEALPVLREQWSDFVVRDAIVAQLAKTPQAEDRTRFVESLGSVQQQTVEVAAGALARIEWDATADELLAAMQALRQACSAKEFAATRKKMTELLTMWSGQKIAVQETTPANLLADYQPWFDWFARKHPEVARKLHDIGGADAESWKERLATVDWTTGDVPRGKVSFEKRACARCHAGADRLGPDLAGAAGRLSRDDLFTAIVDPNKDVAPLYQTTQVVTRSGKVFQGLIVYESPESTLVQTTPDTTVRITGEEITAMRKGRQSLMPTNLLNGADDRELADLLAYMKTLRVAK